MASSDAAPAPSRVGLTESWRSGLRWSATSAPVALLLAIGMALGPQGSNVLSAAALPLLNPVIPVALAALGVLVGLSVVERRAGEGRMATAALLHAAIVMSVVGFGIGTLGWTAVAAVVPSFRALGVATAICAATSLTLPTGSSFGRKPWVTRLSEAGTWMPIVAGGVLLAATRAGGAWPTFMLLAQASAVTLALAAAGWLLLQDTVSPTEERVFALSALLLVGGAADALAGSALLAGVIAGVVWRFASERSRDAIGRNVLFVQHPLIVLVLLVAGARAEVSLAALGLGLAYGLLRAAATLAGARVAAHLVHRLPGVDVGRSLLRPGVFGVAFALNAVTLTVNGAAFVLAVVVLGTIISEALALVLPPRSVAP